MMGYMTSTQNPQLDPSGWKTPKTDSRIRRGVDLPAIWTPNDDGTETVHRLADYHGDGLTIHYVESYRVTAGWGRIAVEQEIEAVDATMRRRYKAAGLATAAIFHIPGYSEVGSN